jgi:uncharacterized protein with gpF-like domain
VNFKKYNFNKVSNFLDKDFVDQISLNIKKQIKLLKKIFNFFNEDINQDIEKLTYEISNSKNFSLKKILKKISIIQKSYQF